MVLLMTTTSWAQQISERVIWSQNGMKSASQYSGPYSTAGGIIITEHYLNKHWNAASILLKDANDVLNYPVRLNLKTQMMELKTSSGIKLLEVVKIKNMVWTDSVTLEKTYFINAGDYTEDGKKMKGLFQLLIDGKMPALKLTTVEILPGDYSSYTSKGSPDEKAVQKDAFYLLNNNEAVRVKNNKELLSRLPENSDAVKAFISDKKINVKKEGDLIEVMKYYNEMAAK